MTAELLTIDGVTRTIPEWARLHGLSRQLLRHRVRAGLQPPALLQRAKLNVKHSDATVAELRRRVAAGEMVRYVARDMGMPETTAGGIARGQCRKGIGVTRSEAR
jgi:hypothetical protein